MRTLRAFTIATTTALLAGLLAEGATNLLPTTIHDAIPGNATIAEIVSAGGGGGGGGTTVSTNVVKDIVNSEVGGTNAVRSTIETVTANASSWNDVTNKQDRLPYLTNAIPWVVIDSAPDFIDRDKTNGWDSTWATNFARVVTNRLATTDYVDAHTPESMTDNAVVLTNSVLKTKGGTEISASAIGNAATTNQLNDVKAIVATWENFLDGSNVVFSITNYLSGAYNLDTAKLRILEMTNGVYHEVYNSRDEIALHLDEFRTNDFASATNEIVSAVDAKIADKAPKAWGQYSSSGEDIRALGITNAVYMTAPTTYFAGGYDWYRVSCGEGAVCVLTANGAAANTYGEDGTFYFKDLTTTNYFGFRTRDNFLLGCDTDGIRTEGQGASRSVVLEYDIDIDAGTYPIILYRPSLENFSSNAWEQLNDAAGQSVAGATHAVVWTNDQARDVCTATINVGTNAAGFFTARTVVQGEAEFVTNMKADFKGGIVTTDGEHIIKPVYASGELTWRTFDYGSGIQVSTPSASQIASVASQKAVAATTTYATYAETNFVARAYADTNLVDRAYADTNLIDRAYAATNFLPISYYDDYTVITNELLRIGGPSYHPQVFIGNSMLKIFSTSKGGTFHPPYLCFNYGGMDEVRISTTEDGELVFGGLIDDPIEYTTSKLTPDGSPVMTSNKVESVAKKLTGVTYDFQSGTNFTLRLYVTLTNIIDRLGGSIANPPTFD